MAEFDVATASYYDANIENIFHIEGKGPGFRYLL